MFRKQSLLIVLLGFITFHFACKTALVTVNKSDLKEISAAEVIAKTDSASAKFKYLNAKFSADIKSGKKGDENSLKGKMRIQRDSVIWLSIAPALGIELGRLMLGPEEVSMINYFQKEYFTGTYKVVSDMAKYPLDFQTVRSVLFGDVFFIENRENYQLSNHKGFYFLSPMDFKNFDKIASGNDKNFNSGEKIQGLWIDPSNFKIVKMMLIDIKNDRYLEANFKNYTLVQNELLPTEVSYSVKSDTAGISIKMFYNKVELNEVQEFPFNIPDSYQKLK